MHLGIVGAGGIVHHCLEGLKDVPTVKVTAIYVQEKEKDVAHKLAEKYDIQFIYTDYIKFLKDTTFDFVYIGIINNLHYEFTKIALTHGKNVINEKPFTSTLKESIELIDIAKQHKLYLFEAITLLYSPNYTYVKENLSKIGKVKLIQCNYSQYSSRYTKYLNKEVLPAFDPKFSGGSLYDINIYNIHFVVGLFGEPLHTKYYANLGFNGIDTSGIVIMEFENYIATCTGAKDSASPSFAIIQGENGYIKINSATNVCESVDICIGNSVQTINFNKHDNHMVNEFTAFAKIFKDNDIEKCYDILDHTRKVIKIIANSRISAGIKFLADEN
ncbi:oxidoreductase [Candidatus Epulonipiscium fishelsonii]|uniref:Oxidoreductase n=1 Tax=Candidatus Epulonipiscium fishelsonii TaxID=77094 RepID=A0ACC8XA43_9FIRM|nr:oxidoreductase [Epulopiscium sp. SCG-B05WGA-EpuloA1]ONI39103.1 oxidoreductase [Epulopiscium sp. SCG-B11WGA-EpuloA1]